ncbi:MAG: acyltransferase 3 [Chthoniobacteraceae bacterium]|nr:acyltransferase 3 [Chthoniobacteraceae bacterium]
MRDIPALDGYRGVAVLMVILFHAQWLPVGWIGVELFFILSSFLITSILREKRERSASDYFGSFWRGRAKRLIPLYFAYLLIVATFFMPEGFMRHLTGLTTFTFNFSQILLLPIDSYKVGHFWSLAVEAQFYLLWPAFVRFLDDRVLRRVALVMILIAPAIRFVGNLGLAKLAVALEMHEASHFLLPFHHLDALGWGAFLALPRTRDPVLLPVGIVSGLLSIACAPFTGREIWTLTAVNLGGAALLCAALNARFAGWFCPTWLRFTGRISFGLYVWHYAMEGWLDHTWPTPAHSVSGFLRLLTLFLITYTIAVLSFYGWERRFLKNGHWKRT